MTEFENGSWADHRMACVEPMCDVVLLVTNSGLCGTQTDMNLQDEKGLHT